VGRQFRALGRLRLAVGELGDPPHMLAHEYLHRRHGVEAGIKRAELLTHIKNTNSQYNLPRLPKGITSKCNRQGVAAHFPDPSVSKSIEVDVQLLDPR